MFKSCGKLYASFSSISHIRWQTITVIYFIDPCGKILYDSLIYFRGFMWLPIWNSALVLLYLFSNIRNYMYKISSENIRLLKFRNARLTANNMITHYFLRDSISFGNGVFMDFVFLLFSNACWKVYLLHVNHSYCEYRIISAVFFLVTVMTSSQTLIHFFQCSVRWGDGIFIYFADIIFYYISVSHTWLQRHRCLLHVSSQ